MNTSTVLLEIKDLETEIVTKDSVIKAINNLTLTISQGETVGVVGESGSGKSMTGRSIMRLLPQGGRIIGGGINFLGEDLVHASSLEMRKIRGNGISMIYQNPMTSLNPTMTIGDQIAEGPITHFNISKKDAYKRAFEVLDQVKMPQAKDRLKEFPHQLSGGLRQRAIIAMALACKPKLLIADEPTTALDVTIQDQILTLLDSLKNDLDMGMLLITHDMSVIAERADKTMVMYAGEVAEEAPTDMLFSNTRHPYTQALLHSIPNVESNNEHDLYSIPGLPPDMSDLPKGCNFAPRCAYATDQCHVNEPETTGTSYHRYACFNPVNENSHISPQSTTSQESNKSLDSSSKSTTGEPILRFENVVREFPLSNSLFKRKSESIKAVSDVSFNLYPGETFGLVGESGCGKSTIARMAVGLDECDSGKILFKSDNVMQFKKKQLHEFYKRVQMVFQDPYSSLDPRMKTLDTVMEPFIAHKVGTKNDNRTKIIDLLNEVGLPKDSAERYPHEFSGGQRQRIGFARAMALTPEVIVADEPVSALDVSIRAQILNLMKQIQMTKKLTYLFISHDLLIVRYLADRIGVMYLGKLVEIGTSNDIYEQTAHPYTAALLEAIPHPDPNAKNSKKEPSLLGELPSSSNPPSGCRFRTRCPKAAEICAKQEPQLEPAGTNSHQVACHFPLS